MQEDGVHKVGTDGVLLGAWFNRYDEGHILDIGTGTGVIALMAAQRTGATITAIDTDPSAILLASGNFNRSPWHQRLTAVHTRLQDFQPGYRFGHILSNPPFFRDSLLPGDPGRLRQRHENEMPFAAILKALPNLLEPEGRFSVILPVREGEIFMKMAVQAGFRNSRVCRVYPKDGKPAHRLMVEFRLFGDAAPVVEEVLFIMDREGNFSPEYQKLGRPFYLGF